MTGAAPTIRPMTRADLDTALGWAAAEGWNPGTADAAAFHAADPGGFLMAEVAGAPAACLSIVRFGDATAFLGLYIAHPDFRGQGIGHALWRAGLDQRAAPATGLDGVPAQQENYRISGFALSHRNLRFTGPLAPTGPDRTTPFAPAHLDAALALDQAVTGFDRAAFFEGWLTGDPSRQARVLIRDGALAGLGVLRTCATGFKVGPLFAADRAAAEATLDGLAALSAGASVSVDVPEPNAEAMALAQERGLAVDFETARMWRGPAPAQDLARTFGVTTFELG